MRTVRPADGMKITESVRFEPGVYLLPNGIEIAASGISIDGEGAHFVGDAKKGRGLVLHNLTCVRLSKLTISNYYHGVYAKDCTDCTVAECNVHSTAEVAANTIFLDIWLPSKKSYGGGICLVDCADCVIENNDLQHQMNGLLTYECSGLRVKNNLCNYNSGFGIHLFGTCNSLFEGNSCDYCCRFEPREGGLHHGHMGADATGFLAVKGSSGNKFIRNTARLGGDGFFLAGLAPNMEPCGCDNNLFEENDASLSPNIAFESTFCQGNIYRRNFADRCGYGFWCGYSKGFAIEDNRMLFNRQAGIAVENGVDFAVNGNQFQSNGHGILLWSHYVENFAKAYPDRDTSHDWLIEKNSFLRNVKAIRIAADQDHGIRDFPQEQRGDKKLWPHSHTITGNDIQDNRIGIELCNSNKNVIRENTLNNNVEANLRLEDSDDNEIVNNIGSRGAYL